jgi:hypothetical protein
MKEIRASRRTCCCTAGRLMRTMVRSVVVVTGESWAAAAAVDWGGESMVADFPIGRTVLD